MQHRAIGEGHGDRIRIHTPLRRSSREPVRTRCGHIEHRQGGSIHRPIVRVVHRQSRIQCDRLLRASHNVVAKFHVGENGNQIYLCTRRTGSPAQSSDGRRHGVGLGQFCQHLRIRDGRIAQAGRGLPLPIHGIGHVNGGFKLSTHGRTQGYFSVRDNTENRIDRYGDIVGVNHPVRSDHLHCVNRRCLGSNGHRLRGGIADLACRSPGKRPCVHIRRGVIRQDVAVHGHLVSRFSTVVILRRGDVRLTPSGSAKARHEDKEGREPSDEAMRNARRMFHSSEPVVLSDQSHSISQLDRMFGCSTG